MKANEFITEGISSEVYHYTSVHGALAMLQTGEIRLTSSVGRSVADKFAPKSGEQFYLSVTRSKVGDYHRHQGAAAVMLNLDGTWFARHYKAKPVDYWDRMWLGADGFNTGRGREAEDRVFSHEPTIPSLDALKEIHILLTQKIGESTGPRVRAMMLLAKSKNIPVFVYGTVNHWLTQDKRKALSPDALMPKLKGHVEIFPGRKESSYLKKWVEIYHHNKDSDLSTGVASYRSAAKLAYELKYSNRFNETDDLSLQNDLQNARKPGSEDYKYAVAIAKIMKVNGWAKPIDFVNAMKTKWRAIADAQHRKKDNETI